MSPDDLRSVQGSWPACVRRRDELLVALAGHLTDLALTPIAADARAMWLYRAVEDLVGLLAEPSRLEAQARRLADTWPDKLVAPTFAVDGQAWMRAAGDTVPGWSAHVERAWRQAWHLLASVLASEALSPFCCEGSPRPDPPGH